MEKKESRNIKVITLGDSCVGKTSIINRIVNKNFNDNQLTTIAIERFHIVRPYKKKNIEIKLTFCDTAEQERYLNCLPKQYIRESHIALLVFSNLKDLEELKNRWFKFYKENANIDKTKFIVIGNKSDLFGVNKEEIKNSGKNFAEEIDAFFITCSAKSEENIDNVEEHILTEAKRLIDEMEKENNQKGNQSNYDNNDRKSQKLDNNKVIKNKKKSGCC